MENKMETKLQKRYAYFRGIEKVFEDYKLGKISLIGIGRKVMVSSTSVANDIKNAFGVDAFEKANAERRKILSQKKRIIAINEGKTADLTYADAKILLENGEIKRQGFLCVFETIVEISRSTTGTPKRILFGLNGIWKIEGPKGKVTIRFGKPNKRFREYKINRHRFKITPAQSKETEGTVFCIKDGNCYSYYYFPASELLKIQSLNLKFAKHHEKFKYSKFLVKVEK